jgi:hypothetical protein
MWKFLKNLYRLSCPPTVCIYVSNDEYVKGIRIWSALQVGYFIIYRKRHYLSPNHWSQPGKLFFFFLVHCFVKFYEVKQRKHKFILVELLLGFGFQFLSPSRFLRQWRSMVMLRLKTNSNYIQHFKIIFSVIESSEIVIKMNVNLYAYSDTCII